MSESGWAVGHPAGVGEWLGGMETSPSGTGCRILLPRLLHSHSLTSVSRRQGQHLQLEKFLFRSPLHTLRLHIKLNMSKHTPCGCHQPPNLTLLQCSISQWVPLASVQSEKPETKTSPLTQPSAWPSVISYQIVAMSPPNAIQTCCLLCFSATTTAAPSSVSWTTAGV